MRRSLLPQILIGLLVAAAIAAGLWVTGGPETARQEKRDDRRMTDLRTLSNFVICVAERRDDVLPETLEPDPGCDKDAPLSDPFTGENYAYTRISDTRFRLCASFERPNAMEHTFWRFDTFDPGTGCAEISFDD